MFDVTKLPCLQKHFEPAEAVEKVQPVVTQESYPAKALVLQGGIYRVDDAPPKGE